MIRETIARAIEARGTTAYRLAALTGVQKSSLSRFLAGKQELSTSRLESLMKVLNISFKLD